MEGPERFYRSGHYIMKKPGAKPGFSSVFIRWVIPNMLSAHYYTALSEGV